MTLSIEDKEKIKQFYILFKSSPKSSPKDITDEMRKFISEKNEVLWSIKKDVKIPMKEREEAFDLMKLTHEILGRQFKEEWRPGNGNGQKTFIASTEQRIKNCEEFKKYLGSFWYSLNAYQQAFIISQVWGSVRQ